MGQPGRVAEEQLRALDRLSGSPEIAKFYLGGGTAIAIHLGHRRSLDLDFFSASRDVDLELVKSEAQRAFAQVTVAGESDVWMRLLCDGTPIDFVQERRAGASVKPRGDGRGRRAATSAGTPLGYRRGHPGRAGDGGDHE